MYAGRAGTHVIYKFPLEAKRLTPTQSGNQREEIKTFIQNISMQRALNQTQGFLEDLSINV